MSKAIWSRQGEHGFTLIEVVVTLVVVGYAFLAISQMIVSIDTLNRRSRNFVIATEYAQRQLEYYRNAGYNAIPASDNFTSNLPSELHTPRTGLATFTDLSPATPGLKMLDITISYTDGISRSIKLSTLVAQRGIDR